MKHSRPYHSKVPVDQVVSQSMSHSLEATLSPEREVYPTSPDQKTFIVRGCPTMHRNLKLDSDGEFHSCIWTHFCAFIILRS